MLYWFLFGSVVLSDSLLSILFLCLCSFSASSVGSLSSFKALHWFADNYCTIYSSFFLLVVFLWFTSIHLSLFFFSFDALSGCFVLLFYSSIFVLSLCSYFNKNWSGICSSTSGSSSEHVTACLREKYSAQSYNNHYALIESRIWWHDVSPMHLC